MRADRAGVCEAPPMACPKHIDPVCGCDGESYRNLCMMKRAGVSMDHEGLCCAPMACLTGAATDSDGDGCADTCPTPMMCEGDNPQGCMTTGCEEGAVCVFDQGCPFNLLLRRRDQRGSARKIVGAVCAPEAPEDRVRASSSRVHVERV